MLDGHCRGKSRTCTLRGPGNMFSRPPRSLLPARRTTKFKREASAAVGPPGPCGHRRGEPLTTGGDGGRFEGRAVAGGRGVAQLPDPARRRARVEAAAGAVQNGPHGAAVASAAVPEGRLQAVTHEEVPQGRMEDVVVLGLADSVVSDPGDLLGAPGLLHLLLAAVLHAAVAPGDGFRRLGGLRPGLRCGHGQRGRRGGPLHQLLPPVGLRGLARPVTPQPVAVDVRPVAEGGLQTALIEVVPEILVQDVVVHRRGQGPVVLPVLPPLDRARRTRLRLHFLLLLRHPRGVPPRLLLRAEDRRGLAGHGVEVPAKRRREAAVVRHSEGLVPLGPPLLRLPLSGHGAPRRVLPSRRLLALRPCDGLGLGLVPGLFQRLPVRVPEPVRHGARALLALRLLRGEGLLLGILPDEAAGVGGVLSEASAIGGVVLRLRRIPGLTSSRVRQLLLHGGLAARTALTWRAGADRSSAWEHPTGCGHGTPTVGPCPA
mmetsp:Transcript_111433/g.240078  ORF Transcript_111433/g.240078 Transcript_111433/m.240078 type:complete len:487 (+) Transcript_111433:15-1475(+)